MANSWQYLITNHRKLKIMIYDWLTIDHRSIQLWLAIRYKKSYEINNTLLKAFKNPMLLIIKSYDIGEKVAWYIGFCVQCAQIKWGKTKFFKEKLFEIKFSRFWNMNREMIMLSLNI